MQVDKKHQLTYARRIGWMWEHWSPYRRELPLLLALTIANAVVLVAYPPLLKWIIESVEQAQSVRHLLTYVGWLTGLGVVHFVIYLTLQTHRARLNLRFEHGVRMRGFEYLLRQGPTFFARFRTGDIVTRLNDDVNDKLSWFMAAGILRVLEASAIIVAGLAMMLMLNPTLTLYAAGPMPILIGLFILSAGKLHQRYDKVQTSISEFNDSLESCFTGIRAVKAFSAEHHQQQMVYDCIEKQRVAEIRAVRWQTILDSLYGNIWQLGIIGVLLAGGAMAIAGDISLGDIIAFDAYVLLLVWPMFDVGQFLVRGKLSAVCIDRVDEIESSRPEIMIRDQRPPRVRTPHESVACDQSSQQQKQPLNIEFNKVCYRFAGARGNAQNVERDALSNVSLTASAGRMTALVGEIGSGKSTALQLLSRIIDPSSGQIRIGEQFTTDWDVRQLRESIGYVSQQPLLLSGTIMENIRLGRDSISDDDLEMAIEIAQLSGDLASWNDGLQKEIGSMGAGLSGGQKQRVALARALAGRPSLLLLDDCTASLDAHTEEMIWRRLFTESPDLTTLVVTHRTATLERADHIILFDQGQVRERGPFAALNQTDTLFHRLYIQWKLWEDVEKPRN